MRRAASSSDVVSLSLVVTPMLDMAFQLLAFFVMTYHPSALEGHLVGDLAAPAAPAARGPGLHKPLEQLGEDVEPRDSVLIRVLAVKPDQKEHGRKEGEPSRLLLQLPQDATPSLIADASLAWPDALRKLRSELHRAKVPVESDLRIEGDGELRYRFVVEVYDACRAAGFRHIAIIVPKSRR